MGSKNKTKSKHKKPGNLILFIENLKQVYQHDYPKVEKGLKINRPTTFRINKSKANFDTVKEDLERNGFKFQKGILENSFFILKKPDGKNISDTDSFINGLIYVQEFASMLPPIILDPQPGEKILDMASAPGSKTTQIADLAQNKAEILAIEKHPIRIKTLLHNINIQGSQNVKVVEGNGIKFDKRNPQYLEYFDKIQVDAPCSSEGRFNLNDPKSYKYWNIHKRRDMSKIQKGLLISGIRMLKPGGRLVYSTCTFGMEENELVLDWLLQKFPELKIDKLDLPIQNIKHGIAHASEKNLNPQIKNALRIIPNEYFGGFFVVKITKVT